MAKIEVKAKITGVHAKTGLYLVEGETYLIEEEAYGEEIFERVPTPKEKTKKEA